MANFTRSVSPQGATIVTSENSIAVLQIVAGSRSQKRLQAHLTFLKAWMHLRLRESERNSCGESIPSAVHFSNLKVGGGGDRKMKWLGLEDSMIIILIFEDQFESIVLIWFENQRLPNP